MVWRIRVRLLCERGDALISGLLALGLVLLTVALAVQALAYAHARNVAQAAAQDGAETAAGGHRASRRDRRRRGWRRRRASSHRAERDERYHGRRRRAGAARLPRRRPDAARDKRARERSRRALSSGRNKAMSFRALTDRLASERGEATMVSGLLLPAVVLIPLMFLIALYARIELAQVDSQQAARDAMRSAVQAHDASAAHAAAAGAVAREGAADRMPLALTLTGTYGRGQVMSAQVTARVPIGSLPLLGHFGTITVHGRASAPVDQYRSLLDGGRP